MDLRDRALGAFDTLGEDEDRGDLQKPAAPPVNPPLLAPMHV